MASSSASLGYDDDPAVSHGDTGHDPRYKSTPHDEHTSLLTCRMMSGGNYGGTYSGGTHCESDPPPFMCEESSTSETYVCLEERLKTRIKYFFMNPLEKWRTKGKFPWKLILQVVKIIFVTVQLCIFGSDGYAYEVQKQHISASFRHIFLRDWLSIREVVSYPPSTGPYAVYTKTEFYDNVNHVVRMYANITNIALGTYSYDGAEDNKIGKFEICRQEYLDMSIANMTFSFDNRIVTSCHLVPDDLPPSDPKWAGFSTEEFFKKLNDSIKFERLISVNLKFAIRTIFLNKVGAISYPNCYKFDISVDYDNKAHDGQMMIVLSSRAKRLNCKVKNSRFESNIQNYNLRQLLNVFIIFICFSSLLLCIRCLCKGYRLCQQTDKYFIQEYRKPLATYEKLEFVDGWYCMMIVNDAIIIAGSILKACIEQRTVEADQYTTCAILLGVGNLLVWAGVLRYLGFFRKYNILILTVKTALPNVMRFMLCCILLYGGFCFCGWLVLGPYHIKFQSLSTTSECLFAMMNGDDLFATFAITDTNSALIWWFSRVYLYLFISVFIYVVISLFISVIMDSYETVKDYYRNGSPPTRIQALIADCSGDSCSTFYKQQKSNKKTLLDSLLLNCYRMCCRKKTQETL